MNFVWDDDKCRANARKHGIDFVDVVRVFNGYTLTYEDDRFPYDEQRFITIGLLHETVVLVAHTEINDTIRIIHARKADRQTSATFFRSIGH